MLTMTAEEIGGRAETVARSFAGSAFAVTVIDGASTIGGGSAPGSALPTRLLRVTHPALSATDLEARLRAGDPPVVARIENDVVLLDLRTVLPEEEDTLVACVLRAG
jgi:L-seryl-tRNA(Ser) seleniumtransferase